ncbi:MAG: hypothetical protein IJJ42_10410 [Clostridia bacterium]|nr:hypothetical protein [Clostridia bacterium]
MEYLIDTRQYDFSPQWCGSVVFGYFQQIVNNDEKILISWAFAGFLAVVVTVLSAYVVCLHQDNAS